MPSQFFTVASIQALVDKYAQEGSKVFDAEAYKAKYLNDPNDPLFSKPLEHFLTKGAALGYNPLGNFPLKFFDADFYAKKYEELGKLGVSDPGDLFGHYLLYGMGEGRPASQDMGNFYAALYLETYPAVEAYLKDHPSDFNYSFDCAALVHFIKFGAFQGFIGPTREPDNNDIYSFNYLLSVKNKLAFLDDDTTDRDTLQLSNDAINFNDSGKNTINLGKLKQAFGIDFDVLDISQLTENNLVVQWGDQASSNYRLDDLVLGDLSLISKIESGENGNFNFWLSDTTLDKSGTAYVIDLGREIWSTANAMPLFSFKHDSFQYHSFEQSLQTINASLLSQGVSLTLTGKGYVPSYLYDGAKLLVVGSKHDDILVGSTASEVFEGGKGRDVMTGGRLGTFWNYGFSGNLGKAAAESVFEITIDGLPTIKLKEGVEIPLGGSALEVATAIANYINEHPASFNDGNPDNGTPLGATVRTLADNVWLEINYLENHDILLPALISHAGPDADNPDQIAVKEKIVGYAGHASLDAFVFRPGDSTLEAATADVVTDFSSHFLNYITTNYSSYEDLIYLLEPNGSILLGKDSINYIEAAQSELPAEGAQVANFTEALIAANKALTTLNSSDNASDGSLVSFQYDAQNGYLFQDIEGDGIADQVIILIGVDSTEIGAYSLGYPLL